MHARCSAGSRARMPCHLRCTSVRSAATRNVPSPNFPGATPSTHKLLSASLDLNVSKSRDRRLSSSCRGARSALTAVPGSCGSQSARNTPSCHQKGQDGREMPRACAGWALLVTLAAGERASEMKESRKRGDIMRKCKEQGARAGRSDYIASASSKPSNGFHLAATGEAAGSGASGSGPQPQS